MPLRISDHALVRFIERYKGISLDVYRAELTARITTSHEEAEPGKITDGFAAVIEPPDDCVVTVLAPGHRSKDRKSFEARLVLIGSPSPTPSEPAPQS